MWNIVHMWNSWLLLLHNICETFTCETGDFCYPCLFSFLVNHCGVAWPYSVFLSCVSSVNTLTVSHVKHSSHVKQLTSAVTQHMWNIHMWNRWFLLSMLNQLSFFRGPSSFGICMCVCPQLTWPAPPSTAVDILLYLDLPTIRVLCVFRYNYIIN
jgi:hypothetical protein